MTIIHCEHCGPTRVAPHDTKCPTRILKEAVAWPFHVPEGTPISQPFGVPLPTSGNIVGWWGLASDPQPLYSPHCTITTNRGPECRCGYSPRSDHPDAHNGELFAYVGQHIRKVNSR